MGDLEQVYGEAKAAVKKSARKQNLWTLGITGLGVGAAYKNLQERKKAATRMENFQLSMRPILHQKKELFKNGFDFWEDFYAMNKTYNITNDKDYKFALRQIARKEVLAKFEYDKEDWEDIELNEQSEIQYLKNLEVFEKNKKLYSEFKPYQSAYDKTEGEKIYLSPIKKQIKYVEKNIASNSSLGSRLLTALDLKGDPELEDISVTGARGLTNFIRVPKGYKGKEALITAIETSKNKLGQADINANLYLTNPDLLSSGVRNELYLYGAGSRGPLGKRSSDSQEVIKKYVTLSQVSLYGDVKAGLKYEDMELNRENYNGQGIFKIPVFGAAQGLTKNVSYNQIFLQTKELYDKDASFRENVALGYDSHVDWFNSIRDTAATLAYKLQENIENPRTDAGRLQRQTNIQIPDEKYYQHAFQTVIDNLYVQGNLVNVEDYINNTSTVRDMAQSLLKEAEQRLINEENNTSISTDPNADVFTDKFTFNFKNNEPVELTGANFISQVESALKNKVRTSDNSEDALQWIMQYGTNIIESNKELFKNEPELKNVFNNFINSYVSNINMRQSNTNTNLMSRSLFF